MKPLIERCDTISLLGYLHLGTFSEPVPCALSSAEACERKAAGRGGSIMFLYYVSCTISTKREKQNKKIQSEKWELSPLIRCNDPLES